jgi:hypothetical protein
MVRLTITSWTGSRAAGVLLAVSGLEMRVALRGCPDATRFCFRSGQWLDEERNPVSVEYEPCACDALEDGAWWLEAPVGRNLGNWLN